MKRVLTSLDIQDALRAGCTSLTLDADTVLTDVAREVAARHGVAIREAPPALPALLLRQEADLLITGGKVVLPGEGVYEADVAVRDGRILSLSRRERRGARHVLSAAGLHVLPGLVDPHIHLGTFLPLEQEMVSETRSALRGGITTVGVMVASAGSHLGTFPAFEHLADRLSAVHVVPHLVIRTEQQLAELPEAARRFGIRSFKVYMAGIEGLFDGSDDGFILDAARAVAAMGPEALLLVHCENEAMVRRATRRVRAEKPRGATLVDWERARPAAAEAEAVLRAGFLAREAGAAVYFVHVTSQEGLAAVRQVKAVYPRAHAETCSPYLTHTCETPLGAVAKMVPPFRNEASRAALWQGLLDGTLEVVSTDHVVLTHRQKQAAGGIWTALPGYQQMGVHLAALLSEGHHRRGLPLERLIEPLTRNPARLFGLYPRKGTLLPGADADLVLVDLAAERRVEPWSLLSSGDFSLYDGQRLRGWPVATIRSGIIRVQDGRYVA